MSVSLATSTLTAPDLDRLPLVAAINRGLEMAWAKGLSPKPQLDASRLRNIAERKEGGTLDDGPWLQAFHLLTDDLQSSASLNPLGRTIAHGLMVRTLQQRIRAARLWQRHPSIGQVPITAPVVVLGHMRSGTTRLHRLLACDRRFAFTRSHESVQPVPHSRTRSIISSAIVRAFLERCNPKLGKIHPSHPFAAEEEFGLHAFSFHGAMFEAQWNVPAFARWCEDRERGAVYSEFRKLLQTLRWRRRDGSKIQLLKAPQFMQDLDALLEMFPDARILWMQRDPADVVASSASLVWNQQRVQSDRADRGRIGSEWHRKTSLRQQRAETALQRHSNVPVLKIAYARMSADWGSEMRRVYDFLGLSPERAAMRRMERVARRSDHVGHSYSAAEFGLQPTMLRPRAAEAA